MPSRPPTFKPAHAQALTVQAAQEYEQRRGSARSRGYTSRWDAFARRYRSAHPLCVGCTARAQRHEPSACVDHVVPVKHRGPMFDHANLQALCEPCHSIVKQAIEHKWRAGRLPVEALRLDHPFAVAIARDLLGS